MFWISDEHSAGTPQLAALRYTTINQAKKVLRDSQRLGAGNMAYTQQTERAMIQHKAGAHLTNTQN